MLPTLFGGVGRTSGQPRAGNAGRLARPVRHGLVAVIDNVPLSGIIAARQCSDGMSDREYGLSLDAIFGEQVLSGCCTLAP